MSVITKYEITEQITKCHINIEIDDAIGVNQNILIKKYVYGIGHSTEKECYCKQKEKFFNKLLNGFDFKGYCYH